MIYSFFWGGGSGGAQQPQGIRKKRKKRHRKEQTDKTLHDYTIDVTVHGETATRVYTINGKKPFGYKSQKIKKIGKR